jgi:hypothetical protein
MSSIVSDAAKAAVTGADRGWQKGPGFRVTPELSSSGTSNAPTYPRGPGP